MPKGRKWSHDETDFMAHLRWSKGTEDSDTTKRAKVVPGCHKFDVRTLCVCVGDGDGAKSA